MPTSAIRTSGFFEGSIYKQWMDARLTNSQDGGEGSKHEVQMKSAGTKRKLSTWMWLMNDIDTLFNLYFEYFHRAAHAPYLEAPELWNGSVK